MKYLGKKILELRKALGITQKELSECLGMAEKSIQRYEKGESRPDTYALAELAAYFDVSTDYLLGLSSVEEQIESRNLKISEERKGFYKNYIKCRTNYVIDERSEYYWIFTKDDMLGGQTQWEDFTEDGREIRVLRPVIAKKAIETCTEIYGAPMVINSLEDVLTFMVFGGQAIVKKELCEKHLSCFCKPMIR